MNSKQILDKIEDIIRNRVDNLENTTIDSDKNVLKNITYLMFQFFLNVLKAPFQFLNSYLKDEIIKSIKKDAKLYTFIMVMIGVLFVFFSVIWLFTSVAISVYFHEKGYSTFNSIIYSIGIQIISFVVIGLTAIIASKKIKSLRIMRKIFNSKN